MEEDNNSNEKISLYNSGVAQIKRLDDLWIKTHVAANAGELTKWNWILDRIWCELVGDLKEDGEETKDFEKLNKEIGGIIKDFIDKKIKIDKYRTDYYTSLMEKEAFLRRLQNKLGKGTKLVDADEDTFD